MSILLPKVTDWLSSTSGTLVDGTDGNSFTATSVAGSSSAGYYIDFFAKAGAKVTLTFMARVTTEPTAGAERPGGQLELPVNTNQSKVEVMTKEWQRYVVTGSIPLSIDTSTQAVRVALGAFTSSDGGAEFRDIRVDVADDVVPNARVGAYGSIFFNQAGDTISLRSTIINHGIKSVAWDATYKNIEVEIDKVNILTKPFAIARVSGSGSDTSTNGTEQNLIAYCGDYNVTTGKVMVYLKNTSTGGGKVDIATLGGAVTVDFTLLV